MQSVDDGLFAICALIDELAMALPDLRPLWSQAMLQATRFNTTSAGVELFQRLSRVRQGPPSVIATYTTVLGLGFTGSYALPNGLIVKWGTSAAIAAGGNATVTFASPFPSALFGVLLTPLAAGTGWASNQAAASFRLNNGGSAAAGFFWLALGT